MNEFITSLGQVSAIIGAQWGDEGKGKVTDILAEHFDVIARAAGGANAGHTIVIDGQKHVFHLLPSGCLHAGKPIVLGAGMVIHLPTLLAEISTLKEHGLDILPQLQLSPAAHIVFDFHKELDTFLEEQRSQAGNNKIGTTKRGIGPAYSDKAARQGLRLESLGTDISQWLKAKAQTLSSDYGIKVDLDLELEQFNQASELLKDRVTDTVSFLHQSLAANKSILIEGAQGTLLDLDHGSYPYVTSSATTTAGALQGLGLPPRALSSCVGIAKAYCTRVGEGPFATELPADEAARIRDRGGEYGATTGRPRRCGWLHLPDLLKAAQLNGITHWNLTKLDVLDEEATINVGTEMTESGAAYQALPGWQSSTVGLTNWSDLPPQAKAYIEFIEQATAVPVALIGTGQARNEMIIRS